MDKFVDIVRTLSSLFGIVEHGFHFWRPRKGSHDQVDQIFFEVGTSSSHIRIFDPLRKRPRFEGNIMIEFYNVNLTPKHFIGEVRQNVFENEEFIYLVHCILDREDPILKERDITERFKKFII